MLRPGDSLSAEVVKGILFLTVNLDFVYAVAGNIQLEEGGIRFHICGICRKGDVAFFREPEFSSDGGKERAIERCRLHFAERTLKAGFCGCDFRIKDFEQESAVGICIVALGTDETGVWCHCFDFCHGGCAAVGIHGHAIECLFGTILGNLHCKRQIGCYVSDAVCCALCLLDAHCCGGHDIPESCAVAVVFSAECAKALTDVLGENLLPVRLHVVVSVVA